MSDTLAVPLSVYRFAFTGKVAEYFRMRRARFIIERHGQSPQAFADLMRRPQKEAEATGDGDVVLRYFNSRPATEDRIRRAKEQR